MDSEMLKYLIEHYALREDFEVVQGLVSDTYCRGANFFHKYINSLFEAKAKQDRLKESGSDLYNPALRETIKMFLNAPTGRLTMSLEKFFQINFVARANSSKDTINGTAIEKNYEQDDRRNLWVIAGVMMYSYSKRLLFEYIRCLPNDSDDVIHVETDAIYFDAKYRKTFEENVTKYDGDYPVGIGGTLGYVKLEHISQGDSYFLGKKFYYIDCSLTKERKKENITHYDFQNPPNIVHPPRCAEIMKIKGIPKKTIDENGNPVVLVSRTLYEEVFSGKSVTRWFSSIKRTLNGETRLTSYKEHRTVNPKANYRTYE